MENGTTLCSAGLGPSLIAVRRGGQMCARRLSVPRHSHGKASRRLPAACWDFYVRIPACAGCVLFCKPAAVCWLGPKNHDCLLPDKDGDGSLLPDKCWLPLARREHGLKVSPCL